MVQAFTNDRAKLKSAIASSTSGTFTGVTDDKAALEQATAELQRLAGPRQRVGPRCGEPGRRLRGARPGAGALQHAAHGERAAAPAERHDLALPADRARQGPADAGRPQDAALLHRAARRPPEPRRRLPLGDLGGQPRQRLASTRSTPAACPPSRRWPTRARRSTTPAQREPGRDGEPRLGRRQQGPGEGERDGRGGAARERRGRAARPRRGHRRLRDRATPTTSSRAPRGSPPTSRATTSSATSRRPGRSTAASARSRSRSAARTSWSRRAAATSRCRRASRRPSSPTRFRCSARSGS